MDNAAVGLELVNEGLGHVLLATSLLVTSQMIDDIARPLLSRLVAPSLNLLATDAISRIL